MLSRLGGLSWDLHLGAEMFFPVISLWSWIAFLMSCISMIAVVHLHKQQFAV